MQMLKRLWKDEEGQDLVEYALLIALIALVAATAFPSVASAVQDVLNDAITKMSSTTGAILIRL